jgi:hypothetical protein
MVNVLVNLFKQHGINAYTLRNKYTGGLNACTLRVFHCGMRINQSQKRRKRQPKLPLYRARYVRRRRSKYNPVQEYRYVGVLIFLQPGNSLNLGPDVWQFKEFQVRGMTQGVPHIKDRHPHAHFQKHHERRVCWDDPLLRRKTGRPTDVPVLPGKRIGLALG